MEEGGSEATVRGVFRQSGERYNRPGKIVTLGDYLGVDRLLDAHGAIRYAREGGDTGYRAREMGDLRDAVRWTRWINALNAGRRWTQTRLFERLDPLLESDVAIAIVPSHDPFQTDPPLRELAQRLTATGERIDATGCLVRHTKIKRIVWGGPSYRSLHQQTIRLHDPDRIVGRPVLLLDDIARSGASLRACEEILYEGGAALVQAVALGRVV